MSRDLKEQLKNLKHSEVSPRPEWLSASRASLLSQIRNTIPAEKPNVLDSVWRGMAIFLPQKFVYNVVRPVAILLIVAMVGTSGWIATVDASYEALPGDWLYPAKRAMEKTQVTAASIMGAKNTETKLHAEFAKRRAAEIKKVVQSDDPDKQAKVTETVGDLKMEMKSVDTKLEAMKTSNETGDTETAKEIQKNSEQIKTVLKEVKDDLSISTSTEEKAMAKEIGEAKDMAKDTSVKAVEALVANHLSGGATTADEVKEAIGKTMQSVVNDMAETKQNVETMKNAVEAVTDVKNSISSTTPEASAVIDNVAEKTAAAVVKTTEAGVEMDKKVSETNSLMQSGNLSDAVSMMKEASETTKAAEKIQDTAIISAQQVLPTPVITSVKEQVIEASQNVSSTEIKMIATTTVQAIEPGKLPVTVIVTTTAVKPATTSVTTIKK
ncbi:MAG: DUF5667 domain-containing protein [Candidatus Magasanikbacteria bacterium]|nr:DUF5667 domain-containing protein [Candidatus Magasanikbacteria bacterium]